VGPVPGAGDRARQLQGGPVSCHGLVKAALGAIEGPGFVERLSLASRVTDVPVDAQRLLKRFGRPAWSPFCRRIAPR
jgi:hypothetical protein